MKKILYFEGMGYAPCGDVENCRIRSAFHLNNGNQICIEFGSSDLPHPDTGYINFSHYFNGDNDKLKRIVPNTHLVKLKYSKAGILNYINSLGCNFDEIVVPHKLAGYQVYGASRIIYFGDEFTVDEENLERALEIKQYFYNLERSEGKLYPNFGLYVDEFDKSLLRLDRSVNGGRKYYTVRCDTDNWLDTMVECA